MASERGSALARWHEYRYRTVRAALIGDFPAARSWNAAARDLAMNVGSVSLLGMYYAFQSQLALVRADPGELDPGFIETVQPVRTMPLVRVVFPVHALNGRMDEARAEFEEFRHIAESFPLGVRWFGTIVTIGYAAELIEDVAVAEEVYGLIAPIADYYSGDGSGAVFNHGANARLAGGLAYLTGSAAARHHARSDGCAPGSTRPRPRPARRRTGGSSRVRGSGCRAPDRRGDQEALLGQPGQQDGHLLGHDRWPSRPAPRRQPVAENGPANTETRRSSARSGVGATRSSSRAPSGGTGAGRRRANRR